jgi:5-hydroxyisourate hydrolase
MVPVFREMPEGPSCRDGLRPCARQGMMPADTAARKGEAMAGYLTTHVLDTARGVPAAGVAIALFRVDGAGRSLLAEAVTNGDGRTDAPILAEGFAPGTYELVFRAGDYLRASGQAGAPPLFLDLVPIRFGISDAAAHYHVPLLLSAYGYSTYRGS